MNKKIYILFALTAGLFISVHASENVNTTENRQFLKQQETLSQQLREKPGTQLQAWAEQQVRANPLQHSDNQFLDELVRKQQAAQKDKPQQGAVYFVSFSIPEEGLKRMLGETRHYGIPATLRGMVNNDLKATADAVLSLVKDGATDGVQIDPTLFSQYGIRSVPALVVFCSQGHDIIRGNLRVRQALEKVAATGDCRQVAQGLLDGTGDNYYTDKDNYYVLGSMGERWAGKGAEQLGLQGSVDKDVFTRLLEGRLPDGADLSRMQDGSNKHRPGYDLTFSAPKSVSMMAMLGGDKRLIDAHNQAVDFAVRQVEALASTRVMTDGQSETVLTGNLVMALFNHDTSRDQEPQLHTHAVVANVTQHNGEWKTLSTDKVGKTGFIENVYANQIAFGRLYREKLKEQVEALGYETEVVGKHGMWEMPGVPVEAFSGRSQAIREAVGEDASLKSRDVAALDTRKSKQHVDPEVRMAEWMQTLKETGFDIRAYRDAADQRAEIRTQAPGPASQDGPDVQQAVTQAIAGLSERKVQFTYTDVLARTVGILPPENGVIERARAGIDEAISREQLIPLDREKGLFTSGIHVLDELSVRALSRDIMKQNRVTVHPEKSVPRTAGYSDAVSVLAQDRPSLAIVSGQGGAAGQRERVAELAMMAREQGREVQIIAADRRSQMNLKQDERLSGELITGRRQLQEGMAFTPGSTVIVDQGEKLSLKETLTLLDGAARHNVQVLITDSGQRTGTGSALMAMKDAGVNTYRWQGGEQRPATIISEPDRNVRYARLRSSWPCRAAVTEKACWLIICRMVSGLPVIILTAVWW